MKCLDGYFGWKPPGGGGGGGGGGGHSLFESQ